MDSQQTNSAIVQRIREKFLIECEKNPELYHEIDVQRVRTDDWQIERFVAEYEGEDSAYDWLVKALKWKKAFGIHDRTDQYFPREFYEFSETHTFGRDKEGRVVQWEKNRNERKISEMNLLFKQFAAHILEKLDAQVHRQGFIMVSDTNGAGLSNVNMDLFKFKIELTTYYPEAIKANLFVDLPWVLTGVAKVILSFCGQKLKERVKFISRKELEDYVDIDLIPTEIDGKREPKCIPPEGVQSIKQSPQLDLTEKVIEKYYKSYNQKI